ncbi:MAG: putative peptidoglycan lipid flippase [Actinomycetota bacterium]|nr:putative peptidoglycan lipid flippase [Actinomycetota bacterium]MEA2973075.1 putative peptidoglycan lipid flippase [Actinomycetota bacterium]
MTAPSPLGRPGSWRVGLAGPTAQVTAGNVVSRATGLLRVLAIGGALGTTFLGNVYQTANLVSNLLFELLAAGMLSSVLVPPFVALLGTDSLRSDRRDPDRRADVERLAGALLGMTLAVMAVVTVAGLVARPWIMRALTVTVPDADIRQAEIRLGSFLLIFFIPQVLLYVVGAVATAVLHSTRRFAAAALAPVANNVIVIATLGAFWAVTHGGGRGAGLQLDLGPKLLLAVGTTAGVVAMTAVPVLAARRAGLRLRPRWDPHHPGLKALGRAGLWGAAALAASQVLLATTLVLANRVEGGVVAFQIAFTMFLFPHALLAHPVLTTLYPRLAADAVERRWAAFAAALGKGARTIVFWTAPATALLAVLGGPALRLIRVGALDPDGARLVAGVLAAYAFGLTGYAGIHLLTRASYAAGDLRTPAVVSLGVAVGGSVLMVAGVAAATGDGRVVALGVAHSVAMVVGAVCLLALVRRRVGEPVPVAAGVARAGVGAAVAAGVAAAARAVVEGALGADSRLAAAVTLAVAGTAGGAAYLAAQRLLRAPELVRTGLVPALDGS